MLKTIFTIFSLLGAIFILASCGVGKDAVTDTKYKVSLRQVLKSTKRSRQQQTISKCPI